MSSAVNLREFEALARERLSPSIYDWCAGGTADEITLRENEAAWSRIRLCPRVLVDVSACNLGTTILGRSVAMPVMIAPCGKNALLHPEGERAVARAAEAAGVIQVLSTASSFSLEEVAAAAAGPRWFQLYFFRDRAATRALVERAEAAGYAALCLTVDAPSDGLRERDTRNRLRFPAGTRLGNLGHVAGADEHISELSRFDPDPSLDWASLDWLRGITRLPLVLKGILAAEEAGLAVDRGVKGVVVSNHGGRELDTAVATCEALGRVAETVSGRAEIYVDGGIRRGTDVLKALALGARAVLVGRPCLWGLAAEGEAGVRRILELLCEELRVSMALAGCPRIGEISRRLIAPGFAGWALPQSKPAAQVAGVPNG
jgi:4-hydroxymandelate oxidase